LKVTHKDFKRSDRFLLGTAKDTWNGDIAYHWLEDGKSLAYKHQDSKGTEYRKVDIDSGRVGPLFDHDAMAEMLSPLLESGVDPKRLPINTIAAISGEVYTLISGGKVQIRCECRPASPAPHPRRYSGPRYSVTRRRWPTWDSSSFSSTAAATWDDLRLFVTSPTTTSAPEDSWRTMSRP
jgi:hypothetical protein